MTTNTRVEAAVQAEAKRIEAWNSNEFYPISGPMTAHNIRSLAAHLVRNRIQVEQVGIEAARLTVEEILKILDGSSGGFVDVSPFKAVHADIFAVANAATAKALRVQDARHEALVAALRKALEASHNPTVERILQAALKAAEEEAPHA